MTNKTSSLGGFTGNFYQIYKRQRKCSPSVLLKLECAIKSPESCSGEDFDPVGQRWGLRFHISNKLPHYARYKDFYKSLR